MAPRIPNIPLALLGEGSSGQTRVDGYGLRVATLAAFNAECLGFC